MPFTIRDAVPEDSDKLIELASLTPMKGIIELQIARKPDFFRLLNLSESFILLVAENDSNQITGCFASTKSKMQINGRTHAVYYLRDLKVHPGYKGSTVAYSLVKKMYERLLKEKADILCCTMASGNDAVVPFFKGRAGIPAFVEISTYNIYQVLPSPKAGTLNPNKTLDSRLLVDFFNTRFKQYTTSPSQIQPEELKDCINFCLADGTKVDAAIAAFDPYPFRQNIVTNYSFSIALLLTILKFLKIFLRLPTLPVKKVPLQILYAKYYASNPGKEESLKKLIQQLSHYAFIKRFHLVAIGADKKDRLMTKLLKPLSSFVFTSTLLATSLQKNEDLLYQMKQGTSYEDYSLI